MEIYLRMKIFDSLHDAKQFKLHEKISIFMDFADYSGIWCTGEVASIDPIAEQITIRNVKDKYAAD